MSSRERRDLANKIVRGEWVWCDSEAGIILVIHFDGVHFIDTEGRGFSHVDECTQADIDEYLDTEG